MQLLKQHLLRPLRLRLYLLEARLLSLLLPRLPRP